VPRFREFRWDSWAYRALDRHRELRPDAVAVDTETTGLGFYDSAFCATLTWPGPGGLESYYIDLEDGDAAPRLRILSEILTTTPVWVFHNAKFDLQKLILSEAITWEHSNWDIEDTQTLAHLLNENERKALKHLARVVLGEDTGEEEALKKVRRKLGLKKADGYQHIPREYIVPYALKDTEFTYSLWKILRHKLSAKNDGALVKLYEQEMELTKVLLRMESNGLALDLEYLDETTSEYGERVMRGWQKIVALTGKPELNPQSPVQLKQAFADRGVFIESTAVDELGKLEDELAKEILAYRSDKKMHTTYLKTLQDEQRAGLVHPWFNATGARTGRMSSSSAKE